MTVGEVSVGLPDVFWVTAYFLLGLALLNQYKILFQPANRTLWSRLLIFAGALVVLTLIIYALFASAVTTEKKLDILVNSFYPAADALLLGIALWLAHKFTGGALTRPWMGLLVFSVADLLYAWSIQQRNFLSLVADIAYLTAYSSCASVCYANGYS